MAQGAQVHSIDAIKQFRAALVKFAEMGNVALTAGESDIDRVLVWLERDQTTFWNGQLGKRHELVVRCEDALRQKRIFKGPDGSQQSVVDETKALNKAKILREEAEQKTVAVKKAIQILRKESMLFKGRTQKLATALQIDIPRAIHQLDALLGDLENYLSIQTQGVGLPMTESALTAAKPTPASQRTGHDRLRDRSPSVDQRRAAARRSFAKEDDFFVSWQVGSVQAWQLGALAKLSLDRQPVDPEQRVVVWRDFWREPRIFLHRSAAAFEGDSGWFAASADLPSLPAECESLRAGDLVAAQADLAHLLSLPVGFLIVLDSAGIVAIVDGAGLDVWAVALMNVESAASGAS